MTKTEYIKCMYSILVPMCAKYGYHNVAAGMIAQSIQEGWNSALANKYFNYWGMKGESNDWKGEKVAMNNKAKTDPAVYRVYHSMEEGCEGYFQFLRYPRYSSLKNCTTDLDYLSKIGPCGWNSNYKYGERCAKHLQEVYNALSSGTIPVSDIAVTNPKAVWQLGKNYITQQDLHIRRTPDGDKLRIEDVTQNAREHAYVEPDGAVVLRRGTVVTVEDIEAQGSTTWLKIPSGWICGKNSKNIYVM